MKTCIATFVKTPGVSPIKTRLAQSIGREKAEKIFLLFCKHIESVCKHFILNNSIDCYWAIAEEEQLSNPLWKDLKRLWTGIGDLGERMERVYNTLSMDYENVFLMGADSPQISVQYLEYVLAEKVKHDIVITPTVDGGFCILGGSVPIPRKVWLETEYSRSDTLKNFLYLLNEFVIDTKLLPELYDIDTFEDLNKVIPLLSDDLKASFQ